MKTSYIKSNSVIILLTLLSVAGFIIVENTMTYVKQKHYNEKMEAAVRTKNAIDYLKNYRMKNVLFVDDLNDPNETGIVGQKYSQITTENSPLPIKLSTTNPNFAALAVQLLKDADVKEGDKIAVCMSGSFPALNIAVLSALEVLKVNPIVIISVSSSSWGANDPEFTFPDMIHILKGASVFKTIEFKYASIGGMQDLGMSLSKTGRSMIIDAIERNGLVLIDKGDLQSNISERMKIIDAYSNGKPLKAFINVGGGIASLGTAKNGEQIPSGLTKNMKLNKFPDKTGCIYEMAKRDVPIINFLNLEKMMKDYKLPVNPVPLPEIGEGELYTVYQYNLKIVIGITAVLLLSIALFVYIDRKKHQTGNDIISDEIQI